MISAINLFSSQYIGGGSNVSSAAIPLTNLTPDAKLYIDILASGGIGDVKGEYLIASAETDTFIEPASASDIFTGHKNVSGTGGKDFYAITSPILAPFMKIKFSNTDGTNVTITANLIVLG